MKYSKYAVLFSVLIFSVVLTGAESLEMNVEPEDPSIGDTVFIEVQDHQGQALEGVEVNSRNNFIGETDENGILTFTPSSSEEYVLTAEKNDLWVQKDFLVEGVSVAESAERSVDQPVTGQFIEEPSNMYYLGFLAGAIIGVLLVMQYTGRVDIWEKLPLETINRKVF